MMNAHEVFCEHVSIQDIVKTAVLKTLKFSTIILIQKIIAVAWNIRTS